MSDFGANIFDHQPPARPPRNEGRRGRADRAEPQRPDAEVRAQTTAPTQTAAPSPSPTAAARPERTPAPDSSPAPAPRVERAARPATDAGTIAVFVDLDRLLADARSAGFELVTSRLLGALTAESRPQLAQAFARKPRTTPAGMDMIVADGIDAGLRLAGAALASARRGATVVLAPASPPLLELAVHLQAAGHRVEMVAVDPSAVPAPLRARPLGRECVMVP